MKKLMKREQFYDIEATKEKIAERTEENSGRRLLKNLPAEGVALGKVCYHPRRVP